MTKVEVDWWKFGVEITEINSLKWTHPIGLNCLPDWEKKERDWIIENVSKGGVLVDVGAHMGAYSINLAKHFDLVYAIDPHPINAHVLRMNVALNNLTNVKVIEKAAWNSTQKLFVIQPDGGNTAAAVHCSETEKSSVEVEADRLDNIITEEVAKLVKIDVEGSAVQVLDGAQRLIKNGQFWFISLHNEAERDITMEAKQKFGYKMLEGGEWNIGGVMMKISIGDTIILFR